MKYDYFRAEKNLIIHFTQQRGKNYTVILE